MSDPHHTPPPDMSPALAGLWHLAEMITDGGRKVLVDRDELAALRADARQWREHEAACRAYDSRGGEKS